LPGSYSLALDIGAATTVAMTIRQKHFDDICVTLFCHGGARDWKAFASAAITVGSKMRVFYDWPGLDLVIRPQEGHEWWGSALIDGPRNKKSQEYCRPK
jgi:hypothetical protein